MTVIESTAKTLHMNPDVLLKESLEFYIEQKISAIEADIFLIAKKYGVKDVFEMDKRIEEGIVNENEAYDDYFHLDHLEVERRKLKQAVENL
ncbi:MAG: hypothetical protein ACM3SY_03940 [Candidatus Omnitrophota bacterium]